MLTAERVLVQLYLKVVIVMGKKQHMVFDSFLWATYVQYIVLRCWYYTLIVCPRVQYDGIAVTLLRKYLFLMRELIEA